MIKQLIPKTAKTLLWLLLFLNLLIVVVLIGQGEVAAQLLPSVELSVVEDEKQSNSEDIRTFGQDWLAPTVAIKDPTREIQFSSTEFSIISDEKLKVKSAPAGWELNLISTDLEQERYFYLLKTNSISNGEHEYELIVEDESGNLNQQTLIITAKGKRPSAPAWPNAKYYMPADSLVAIASKEYRLPQDYEPQDLVSLKDYGIAYANNAKVRRVAIDSLKRMTDELTKQGINYTATSAYRSYADQSFAYNYWLDYYDGGVSATDSVSARPGHSEHQLGVTIDFITSENGGYFFMFENTRLARWLANNAWKYGFVISYPKGKQSVTGYTYEPWHYRYIGEDNAKVLRQSKLTLTEWLLEQNQHLVETD